MKAAGKRSQPMPQKISEQVEFENLVHILNYRWNMESLALWKGESPPFEAYRIYEGYEDFLSLETLARIALIEDKSAGKRLKHGLIDHYLQRTLLPHETEMQTWMRGAVAEVGDEKVYFSDIISWCQKSSTYEKRQVLQKETSALCKFLKPFALNCWNTILDTLQKDLGFENYVEYCGQKKGIDYAYYYETVKKIIAKTDELYFPAMGRWSRKRFGRPLGELTRFDAINILSLGEFDKIFPEKTLEDLTAFFDYWGIDLKNTPGLNIELGRGQGKSAQAICFIFQAPDEVYILMRPEGGWVDLETLWHELGHGLAAVFTSPGFAVIERNQSTSFSLSESYAFLLQNLTLSLPFLRDFLGLNAAGSKELLYYKTLKDLSVFRRYAAKFIAEFEMFSDGNIADGEPYAEILARYTGFYYQPESHLFDLTPEFYSLDYLLGWMAEAILENHLREGLGPGWIFQAEAGRILKNWWKQGNRYDIFRFLERNDLGLLTPDRLLRRWNEVLGP